MNQGFLVYPKRAKREPFPAKIGKIQTNPIESAKGKRYPLPLLLTLLMLGKLAGETTVSGVVNWVRERQGWLRRQLDWPKRFNLQ